MPHDLAGVPADLAERCATTDARIAAGEPMTLQYIADQLGITFEVLALCLATYCMTEGIPFVIDTSPLPKHH